MSNKVSIKNGNSNKNQRALIFQGGGALGAYEAGVFKTLHDKLIDKSEKENRPLFDIVAGTSAGAINATLLVNYVIEKKTWRDSADILLQFWNDVSTSTGYLENPFIQSWQNTASFFREQSNNIWKPFFEEFDKNTNNIREKWPLIPGYYLWPDKYGNLASSESSRRYWSWYQFAYTSIGTPHVLLPAIFQPDFRFFNPSNFMFRYDNTPITKTIHKYWKDEKDEIIPIKTKDGQPRLIIVAVDIQDATTVTFDSYPKEDGNLMSTYGDVSKVKHEIYYDEGIGMEHLLATMSSHLRYKFPELNVKTTYENGAIIEEPRQFMDGFYLSNTPLREVLQSHRDYYNKIKKPKESVPSLDIVIGDLYPTIEKGTPIDPDSINNRVQDVLFHDKSKFDEKAAILVSDYIGISKILWNYIKDKDTDITEQLKKEINTIIRSKNRKGSPRSFDDLISGRFTIDRLIRIEYGKEQQISDSDDIYGKAFEFSTHTINDLIKQGHDDTLNYKSDLMNWF